ncbi:MAG: hypothetical protein ACE5DK_12905 [Paracoccaceae bacterium]
MSLFSTGLKSGATAGDVAPPGRPYVRQVADYRRTIEMWGGVFGKDALDVRLFERDAMKDGDLLTDFCAALGVTMDGFSIPSAQNKSLGGFTLALLRQINLQLAKRKEPRADRLRRRLIRTLGENMDASDRFLGTEKRRDSYHRFYAESNEWVRRNWFPHRAELFSRTAARSNDTPAFDTRGLDERMLAQLASVLIELGRTADK